MKSYITFTVFWYVFLYVVFAFVSWQFNPKDWLAAARATYILLPQLLYVAAMVIMYEDNKQQAEK